MVECKDESGQVILTSAILLAIVIVIVALMLNNIIYATNVAYLGFMDGSKYEDISIKQMTLKEAARSYENEPVTAVRTQYMDDYFTAINYLTNPKGKFVDYKREGAPAVTLPTTETSWDIIITDSDSTVTYLLLTGEPLGGSTPPSGVPQAKFIPNTAGSPGTYEVTIDEGSTAELTVSLSEDYTSDATITYKIVFDGTAEAADIYSATTGSIIIDAGDTTGIISIPTVDDSSYEGTTAETFTVELTPDTFINAVSGSPAYPITATVHISDNDPDTSGGGTTETYDLDIEGFTATCTGVNTLVVTATVHNTGTADQHNVQLELVQPTSLESGSSPAMTDKIALLQDGETHTFTWTVITKKNNVDVKVKAISDDMPAGVNSVTLVNVKVQNK